MTERKLKVYDKYRFHYEVTVKHFNNDGFSIAYYNDRPICHRDAQKLREPNSDNDSEWEEYEERLSEWMDESEIDIALECAIYFDNQERH